MPSAKRREVQGPDVPLLVVGAELHLDHDAKHGFASEKKHHQIRA